MSDAKCELCGEPMPDGEEMFNYHGYSGPCPKPAMKTEKKADEWALAEVVKQRDRAIETLKFYANPPLVDNGPLPWHKAWPPEKAIEALSELGVKP